MGVAKKKEKSRRMGEEEAPEWPRDQQLGCKAEKPPTVQRADGSEIKHKEVTEITLKQQSLKKES